MANRGWQVLVLAWVAVAAGAQTQLSIQGAWRMVSITVTESPAGRRDPFDAFGPGTHTNLQPELMIITGKHYSRTTDTAAQPRPTAPHKTPDRPTLEELQAEWGPFAANAGTYELSGNVLTLRAIVTKDPRGQRANNFTRLRVELEGDTLSLTPIDSDAGPIPNPVTSKYVRVE
jgi:hypothetical protein